MNCLKILYVDDEPDIRVITRLTLENIGKHSVMEAKSGQEALQMVKIFNPDLILLDVMMPIINGQETFKRLQAMPDVRDVPVIFITAKVQIKEIKDYLDMGAIGVIVKPFDPMTLCQQVQDLWQSSVRKSKTGS